jgi:anti-sigma-K factor RskA
MTCPRSEELVALLDEALSPAALAETRRHADACAACRAELDRLAAGILALRAGSPAPEPSPLFVARLESRLAAEAPRRKGLARLLSTAFLPDRPWRFAVAGGAVAVAAAAALVLVPRHRGLDELSLAAQLELSEDYEVVASVGDVESADDAAVVAALDQLAPGGRP